MKLDIKSETAWRYLQKRSVYACTEHLFYLRDVNRYKITRFDQNKMLSLTFKLLIIYHYVTFLI